MRFWLKKGKVNCKISRFEIIKIRGVINVIDNKKRLIIRMKDMKICLLGKLNYIYRFFVKIINKRSDIK